MLTPKQQRFVDEYLIDLNGAQAAIRAGYSADSAKEIAAENLTKPHIAEAIDIALAKRSEKTQIDAEYVLTQAVKLHERCMQEISPFTDKKGNHVVDDQGRPVYIFNAAGAAKALELVGKHVKIQAFKENVEVTVTDRAAMLQRARQRMAENAGQE